MTIALSHGGTTMYSSPSRSDELWVGTRKGIAVLERDSAGGAWRVARHMLADKHISALHQEPESGLFFAGAFHDGLHVSGDHGATWEALGNRPHRKGRLQHRVAPDQRWHPDVCGHRAGAPVLQRRPGRALDGAAGATVGAQPS